jgi:hypothetical protein
VLEWTHLFVNFLDTKHGLANVWSGDGDGFTALHQLLPNLFASEVPLTRRTTDRGRPVDSRYLPGFLGASY